MMQQNGVDCFGCQREPGKAQRANTGFRAGNSGGKGLKRRVASQVRKQVIDWQVTQERVYAG
jgi:hypothetical protein